jgi:hypothetical protein
MSTITARTANPANLVVDSIERIFRYGYSDVLTNETDWTSGRCPEGHWILQPGTGLYRTDEPDEEIRPALILGATDGVKPLYENARDVWEVPVYIEVRYSRRYAPADADLLMQQLESVFTHGLITDESVFIQSTTILNKAPALNDPGLNCLYIHEITSEPFTSKDAGGSTILLLEFTVRCSGVAQL